MIPFLILLKIDLCGIIPLKGTSTNYVKINETAANVNKFIDPALEYIDNTNYFYKQSHIIKSMYNEDHSSGVHIGVESQIII